MMDYSDKKFITTGDDLQNFIKKCKLCSKTMINILYHESLTTLKVKHLRRKKLAIIINSEQFIQGHWIILLIPSNPRNYAIYFDSQNQLKYSNPNIYKNIVFFCKNNNLKLLDKSVCIQKLEHNTCGYHCLNILIKFAHYSLTTFHAYIESVKKNPNFLKKSHFVLHVKKHYKKL